MLSRSTLLHLRIPFSYFLLPVYLFAVAVSPNFNEPRLIWTFIILHLLLYPASNGYNSYFDKDEKSIGGLRNPPPVRKDLYITSLLLDCAAIVLGFVNVGPLFAIMLFIYGIVSKAYSHPSVRLKKLAITGWLTAGFFQGFFTFLMCYVGINGYDSELILQGKVLLPAALSSIMLWGNYPMTQVYQHEEDAKRGDRTISLLLGIRGTFLFVQIVFISATIGFTLYFRSLYSVEYAYEFIAALSPIALYFVWWMTRVWKDARKADYTHTMWLNFISATCLNTFFIHLFLSTSHIMNYLNG